MKSKTLADWSEADLKKMENDGRGMLARIAAYTLERQPNELGRKLHDACKAASENPDCHAGDRLLENWFVESGYAAIIKQFPMADLAFEAAAAAGKVSLSKLIGSAKA